MQGIVYKSTGSWYLIRLEDGRMVPARAKGKFKIDKDISSTNPIAVGDRVGIEFEDEQQQTAIINRIADRRNYIVRTSSHNRHQKHIVAANLDMALLIATVKYPQTSLGFIDRFLVTATAYHIPVVLVVNKTDLLDEADMAVLEQWIRIYKNVGYPVVALSARNPESVAILQNLLQDKTTLFSGHSGVGKSTLINLLIPDAGLRTEEISGYSGKGQHTTTFAEMFDLPFGGTIIDTPGVKEFGLIDIEQGELAEYYPEMKALLSECRFSNCKHLQEPGCAVKAALSEARISEERYLSYLAIWETLEKKW